MDTKKAGNKQSNRNSNTQTQQTFAQSQPAGSYVSSVAEESTGNNGDLGFNSPTTTLKQVDTKTLKSIHKTADDTVDWTEILISPIAPDSSYNQDMWTYYYSVAPDVLNGDIDTYLRVIYEVNPLDDLLEYGSNFEFGTDNPDFIEVEYTVNTEVLSQAHQTLSRREYNDLLQDFICSLSIRIARDMFALLPINHTIIHAVMDHNTVLSVDFDRNTLSKVKYAFVDPSDTIEKFRFEMNFNQGSGFSSISRLSYREA